MHNRPSEPDYMRIYRNVSIALGASLLLWAVILYAALSFIYAP